MAATIEGARLTESHRLLQVRVSTQAMAAAALLWPLLNPEELEDPSWLTQMLLLMPFFDGRSARAAAAYLETYRAAEGFPDGPIKAVGEFNPEWTEKSLGFNGPGRIRMLVEQGLNPATAKRQAFSGFISSVQRVALDGGRRVVDESALANPKTVGWRRVSDGNPCTFCAMLVSRGPVYTSQSGAGEGRRWHKQCGCSVEEVFGEWTPTVKEERFQDAYLAAAKRVDKLGLPRNEKTILPLMRKYGKFKDSPAPPGASAA